MRSRRATIAIVVLLALAAIAVTIELTLAQSWMDLVLFLLAVLLVGGAAAVWLWAPTQPIQQPQGEPPVW